MAVTLSSRVGLSPFEPCDGWQTSTRGYYRATIQADAGPAGRRTARGGDRFLPPRPAPCVGHGTVMLGLDPSLRGTGYGVIQTCQTAPATLAHGTIVCPAHWPRSALSGQDFADDPRRGAGVSQPTLCVVEDLFYAQNLQTALIMGEARGAALAAWAEAGLEVVEIAPRKVKQAIVGQRRRAEKKPWRAWFSGCWRWPNCPPLTPPTRWR